MTDITVQLTSIQKAITKLSKEMNKRFEQVDKRFEQVDKRFEQVDKRFEQVDKRFDENDQKLARIPDAIRQLVVIELEEVINRKFDEVLGKYPPKDEYYFREARLLGEVKNMREEHAILTDQVRRHSDTIEHLERLHTKSHSHFIRS